MIRREGRSCDTAATLLGVCGVIGFDTLKAVVENLMQHHMHVIKGYLGNAAIVWQYWGINCEAGVYLALQWRQWAHNKSTFVSM